MSVRNRVRKSFSKSLKGKACKFRFTVTYEYVDLKCNNRWQPSCLSIVWFRSHRSKVSEKPTSKVSITDEKTGIVSYAANWFPPNSVDLVVTLYKDFTGVMFRKKDYMFVLENVTADARKKLAIFPCNMAEYASLDMEVFDLEMEFKPLSKKIVSARIGAKVRCEFIKEGRADEDDMQSNFSHLSEAEFKSRLSELAECSDEEEEEEEEENSKPRELNKLADRSKHTWSQFIDEMKTLEYRNVAMLGNPLADVTVSGNNQAYADDTSKEITHVSQETASEEADTKRSKLLERDRDRRKVVSAAFEDLKESTIPEEDGEEDLEDMSINLSSSAMSSLSSFKNKFQFSFSGKNKRRSSDSSSAELPGNIETVPSETREKRVSDWLQENPHEDGDSQLRVEQLEKDNMNLRAAYQKLVTKVTDLEKEKTDMQSELEQLGIMAEFGKSDFARERDELQAEITELQMLVEDLRMQLCEVRGWLCKRGVKGLTGRKWRRRWFSTDKDSRLYYYQKNNNTSPRGFIDLDVIIAVQDQPPSQQDINNACFNVVTPTRTYELMAHDEQEKLRWINALDYLRHWRNRLASSNENK
ncbi:hypothetical protein pdam_00000070 [Pocillopora damicornis]|uniref:PH domain-containing protein n=1 Tax=Pocillopora damicornis TaxID=46731 RepID=A0A3M6UYB8_POCDA|nr:hypothetical protein pdam_00000070 [Pocillopora damicornis]